MALGLFNVWLMRARQNTPYRGGNAQTTREEFAAYGLPPLAMYLVGTLKASSAFPEDLYLVVWLNHPPRGGLYRRTA